MTGDNTCYSERKSKGNLTETTHLFLFLFLSFYFCKGGGMVEQEGCILAWLGGKQNFIVSKTISASTCSCMSLW